MKNTSLKSKISAGFSLVELLVVIAVIGVIAAIAIPNIGNISSSASEATNKRNAQSLASVYASASAAGATFTGTDKAGWIEDLVAGVTVTNAASPFNNKTFRVPGLDDDAQTAAAAYLGTDMSYTP